MVFGTYTTSEKNLIKRIQGYDWKKLERLWGKIKSGKTPRWSAGKALEYMFVRAFDLEGAEVVYPFGNAVLKAKEQLDGFIFTRELGAGFLIECKDWKYSVAFDELAKLHGRLTYRAASTYGIFVSMNGYTPSAVEMQYLVYPHRILLWDANDIDECFKNHKFMAALKYKYQYNLATADPMIGVLDGINI